MKTNTTIDMDTKVETRASGSQRQALPDETKGGPNMTRETAINHLNKTVTLLAWHNCRAIPIRAIITYIDPESHNFKYRDLRSATSSVLCSDNFTNYSIQI